MADTTCDWQDCDRGREPGMLYCAEHLGSEINRWLADSDTTDATADTMSDLYMDGTLLTVRLSPYARTRYEQALWYAWGRQDAGDDRTRGTLAGHYLGDDFAFAEYAALEAESYQRQHRCMLANIGDQYARFTAMLAFTAALPTALPTFGPR